MNLWTANVETGTYNLASGIGISKPIQVVGAGSGGSGTVLSIGGTNSGEVTIAADDITLSGLRLTGNSTTSGVYFDSTVDNDALTDVVATGVEYGVEIHNLAVVSNLSLDQVSLINSSVGFRVSTAGQVSGLTITDSHFDNDDYGLYTTADSSSTSNQNGFTNIQVLGSTTFNTDQFKGIYAEKLDDAVFNGITVTGSGYGTSSPVGIDLNLKYGSYNGGITIENATLTNDGTGLSSGIGLAIRGRNDGSYSGNPATVSNVTLTNVAISGSPTDLAIQNNVVSATLSGVQLQGPGLGLAYTGTAAALNLGDTSFAGSLAGYIVNASSYGIAATGTTFNGVLASSALTSQEYTIEDKIGDALDASGVGLVRLKAGNVYVTPNSFLNIGARSRQPRQTFSGPWTQPAPATQ